MKNPTSYYQERFAEMKSEYQTRRNRADNEVLVFFLPSGPSRVTYLSVDASGVTVCADPGVNLYADWRKGDRFEHMYEAMVWMMLSEGTLPPQMKGDDRSAWEAVPPQER